MLGAIVRFFGRWVAGYVIVFLGTLLIWEVLGVVDREGGKGMALAFVIAPVLGLIGAMFWPLVRPLSARATDAQNEEKQS